MARKKIVPKKAPSKKTAVKKKAPSKKVVAKKTPEKKGSRDYLGEETTSIGCRVPVSVKKKWDKKVGKANASTVLRGLIDNFIK